MATHSHNGQSSSSLSFSSKQRPVRRDDCLVQDCQNLAKLDYETPFRDIFDAVDRLMAFHMMYTDRGQSRESESSKRKFFDTTCEQKTQEFHSRSESIRARLECLEENFRSPKRRHPEEEYRLEKLVSQSVREFYINEKSALRAPPSLPGPIPGGVIPIHRPLEYLTAPESGRKLTNSVPNLMSLSHSEKVLATPTPPPLPSMMSSRLGSKLKLEPSLEMSSSEIIKRE